MTLPRRIVLSEEESVYHCVSRCVRRAFLYGEDLYSGKNYNHRKNWIKNRLKFLIQIYCIEVLACALMDNHQHTMLRTRPDLLEKLSDKEVLLRWLSLYPKFKGPDGSPIDPSEEQVSMLLNDKVRMMELRQRLGSISWFMKSLNEYIARAANKEDNCKGRFWEGRFKCQRLEGEAAILACAVYLDLNPIRAKVAETPETSEHTSAYERIKAYKAKLPEDRIWLTPIADSETRRGFLSMSLEDYLVVLDTTGREIRKEKRGSIPESLAPILKRIGLKSENWISTTLNLSKSFSSFIGSKHLLDKFSSANHKKWLKGFSESQRIFIA